MYSHLNSQTVVHLSGYLGYLYAVRQTCPEGHLNMWYHHKWYLLSFVLHLLLLLLLHGCWVTALHAGKALCLQLLVATCCVVG